MRLLDVTRLIRRGRRTPTGIDRVERAYLRYLLDLPDDVAGLIRTRLGYVILGRAGLMAVAKDPDLTTARHHAFVRCVPIGLGPVLRRLRPDVYINVGHSNLTARVCRAVRRAGGRVVVVVHDTIPLDTPHLQRPQTHARFARFLAQAARADAIVVPSHQTRLALLRHVAVPPPIHVAPLGLEPFAAVRPVSVPMPFVLMLGTIEPRKNLDLMLDVWAANAHRPDWPHLVVCGARGWAGAATVARLDAAPARVHATGPLPQDQVAWLLASARALVFPSLAEGYGLPPQEAAAYGTPVLCADLPVLRETLGPRAQFLPTDDPMAWAQAVAEPLPRMAPHHGPKWHDHFKIVLKII
ncbi:MAG: glycosyltransferase family 4 protein [Paracoccaceae bacterium]